MTRPAIQPAQVDDLDALLARQHGVLTIDQALSWMEPGYISAALRVRRWARPHPRVLVMHNGPLTRPQQQWLALLAAPAGSALYGPTAAEIDGLRNFAVEDEVHVVIPQGRRRLQLDGVTTHWSTHLDPVDVHPLREPRRTRLPRSLLDMASDCTDERRARGVVMAGVQQRLVRTDDLRAALTTRGPCRHHGVLLETCSDLDGGIHLVPEKDFDRIVVSRALPHPVRQAIRRRPDGRFYLDAWWKEYALAAEVDGAPHMDSMRWDDDLDRASAVVADGVRMLRFTSYAVRHRGERVGDLLERALRSGGWRG